MHTIVIASRKGGSAKTTLASHIAVQAYASGVGRVAVIDCDPMGGLAQWWNERRLDGPEYAQIGQGLTATLAELRSAGIALVVIDTPPAASAAIVSIIAAADLVVIPVVPSPNDLRAIGETLDMVETAGRPLVFVICNASTSGKTLTQAAAVALSQHGTVCPAIIRTRTDFRAAMADGRTAGELNAKSKSAGEIADLWRYLETRLNKGKRHGTQSRVIDIRAGQARRGKPG
jgi:chromosome partitioning protein